MFLRQGMALLMVALMATGCASSGHKPTRKAPVDVYGTKPGPAVVLPETDGDEAVYIARKDDTVRSVAGMFGLKTTELAKLNGKKASDAFQIGERVALPHNARYEKVARNRNDSAPSRARPSSAPLADTDTTPRDNSVQVEPLSAPSLSSQTPVSSLKSQPPATPSHHPMAATSGVFMTPQAMGGTPAPAPAATASPAAPSSTYQPSIPAPQPVAPLSLTDPESAPSTATTTPALPTAASLKNRYTWPVSGKVISPYGPKAGGLRNDGLDIAAPQGSPVKAAAGGTVDYVGELKGYGNVVILKHPQGGSTVYGHLDRTLAETGDVVPKGQVLGTVGKSGGVAQSQLHFQVRQNGQPVDPMSYLTPITR